MPAPDRRTTIRADEPESIPAIAAPPPTRDNPFTRSVPGMLGIAFLAIMFIACVGSLPWTLGAVTPDTPAAAADAESAEAESGSVPRYNAGSPREGRLPPMWWPPDERSIERFMAATDPAAIEAIAEQFEVTPDDVRAARDGPIYEAARDAWPHYLLGSDTLGRSLFVRVLTGGGISLTIGIAAALISVFIGTTYGAVAAYAGGKVDAVMMRIVDILYALPYLLLVVLLAVAVDAESERWELSSVQRASVARETFVESRMADFAANPDSYPAEIRDAEDPRNLFERQARETFGTGSLTLLEQNTINVVTLLVAIGGVSWLTMARVVRGQVLSLKKQPFIEAARSIGTPRTRIFIRHLLPNLLGPIVVYTTLTVPQAILQESFLSFLGIGVKPPLPSWGNLAAEGLSELNTYRSHWWLLLFPCVLLGLTLLALNFAGEGLREAFDPKRGRR